MDERAAQGGPNATTDLPMKKLNVAILLLTVGLVTLHACSSDQSAKTDPAADASKTAEQPVVEPPKDGAPADVKAAGTPAELPTGLLVAMAQFVKTDKGTEPGPARLEIVTRQGGEWKVERVEDGDSNVFHKAMVYTDAKGRTGILTMGGTKAFVKFWTRQGGKWTAETIWSKDFGGKDNRQRMRDAEVGDLWGDGTKGIAVATHDQGVVATIHPKDGGYEVKEIDQAKDTFVHEIELGDLDGDGKLEIYATPSEPNRLEDEAQEGHVTQYDPRTGTRKVVADLGQRHAKEIWVGDADGDGRDELYVSVEAKTHKDGSNTVIDEPVEIRRYDAGTDPTKGVVIAKLDDRFCRFLTVGDIDGDGKKEMVVAPFKSGLWLLRPSAKPAEAEWTRTEIDKDSSGFEHAAILLDLDGDKKDELYVASDNQKELRRYVYNGEGWDKEVMVTRGGDERFLTWNLTAIPVSALK